MNFNDNYKLIYREDVYPDCIKFHNINGVLSTVGAFWLAEATQNYLESEGYIVKQWKPKKQILERMYDPSE